VICSEKVESHDDTAIDSMVDVTKVVIKQGYLIVHTDGNHKIPYRRL
jgi:hypothetical protein